MLYCDLCHKYLPSIEPGMDVHCVLWDHCQTKGHQDVYLRKQEELLEEKAMHSEQHIDKLQVC